MPDSDDSHLVHPEKPRTRSAPRRALLRLEAWGRRPMNVAESFVDLCHDQGTRLVNVLDRGVKAYERQVAAQEKAVELQRQAESKE